MEISIVTQPLGVEAPVYGHNGITALYFGFRRNGIERLFFFAASLERYYGIVFPAVAGTVWNGVAFCIRFETACNGIVLWGG